MLQNISRRIFLAFAGGALAAPNISFGAMEVPAMLDHILLGCNDLDQGISFVEKATGVRAAFGGIHPGRGTRNALLSLGEKHYLEIIAPDPAQSGAPDRYGLQKLTEPRLVTWAVHVEDITSVAKNAVKAGYAIDGPNEGSRARPDGVLLRWKSFSLQNLQGSPLPFFIEWDPKTIHPSVDAPSGCTLSRFAVRTTHRTGLRESFRRLGVDVQVEHAEKEQLLAQVSRLGRLVMRLTS